MENQSMESQSDKISSIISIITSECIQQDIDIKSIKHGCNYAKLSFESGMPFSRAISQGIAVAAGSQLREKCLKLAS